MSTNAAPDEGYIKYRAQWTLAAPVAPELVAGLIHWRTKLFDAGLIGAYPDGIGYGNLSIRWGKEFIITGTQTGTIRQIGPEHLAIVTQVDIPGNFLACSGPVQASSEAMTHAAIYRCDPSIQAVAHAHCRTRWARLLHTIPTTDASVPYGTPQMALEFQRLFRTENLGATRIAAMAGHEEGLISFGATIQEAAELLLEQG
ncbi:MAG: class II aldolase/adducin family protein [Chlorobi bacterium CHB2]|nr:class II aldolase/adducin family protein [Chlorobi bacterium CHB2]